jgi:Carboxypeptidase regulatory-like domain
VHQNSAASSGTVLGQWPLEDAKVPRGAVVDLLVSDGNRNIELPANLVRASTDESGRFTKKVTAGSYDVWFQAAGFATVVYQGVQVSPSSGVRLDVGLRPSPRGETTVLKGSAPGRASMIEGTVLDQGGKAMPRVDVTMVRK